MPPAKGGGMEISMLESYFSQYKIKRITEKNLIDVYELCKKNTSYYKYLNMAPTIQNIREELTNLPPGKTINDLYFVGFYKENQLVAIVHFIIKWPDINTAYIGWFMVNKDMQGMGIGKKLIGELCVCLKNEGFKYVKLGCIKNNVEAISFWIKNEFSFVGSEIDTGSYIVISMQKKLD